MAQTSLGFSRRFWPIKRPLFQGAHLVGTGNGIAVRMVASSIPTVPLPAPPVRRHANLLNDRFRRAFGRSARSVSSSDAGETTPKHAHKRHLTTRSVRPAAREMGPSCFIVRIAIKYLTIRTRDAKVASRDVIGWPPQRRRRRQRRFFQQRVNRITLLPQRASYV